MFLLIFNVSLGINPIIYPYEPYTTLRETHQTIDLQLKSIPMYSIVKI